MVAVERAGDIVSGVGPAIQRGADAVQQGIRDTAAQAMPALDNLGDAIVRNTTETAQAVGVQLTLWGRAVERGWNWFVRMTNPPWTVRKLLTWALLVLVVSGTWITWRFFGDGVLSFPIIADAATSFLLWTAGFGPFGLFIITAVATLWFFFIPSEPYFFLAVATSPNIALTVTAAALGSVVGACANFSFGRGYRNRKIKKKGDQAKISKWGGRAETKWGEALLFLAMALPAPEIVALGYGASTFKFRKFLVIVTVARFVKWTWVALAYTLFEFTM